MSSTPTDAAGRSRGGRSIRAMSSGAGVAPATGSRSRMPVADRLVRAVTQRIDGAAIGTRVLATHGPCSHGEVAALAGKRGSVPTGQRGSVRHALTLPVMKG